MVKEVLYRIGKEPVAAVPLRREIGAEPALVFGKAGNEHRSSRSGSLFRQTDKSRGTGADTPHERGTPSQIFCHMCPFFLRTHRNRDTAILHL